MTSRESQQYCLITMPSLFIFCLLFQLTVVVATGKSYFKYYVFVVGLNSHESPQPLYDNRLNSNWCDRNKQRTHRCKLSSSVVHNRVQRLLGLLGTIIYNHMRVTDSVNTRLH